MTQIHCDRKHCLNNDKHGICTAETIEYNGRCQTYCTSKHASKQAAGICQRSHRRIKAKITTYCDRGVNINELHA